MRALHAIGGNYYGENLYLSDGGTEIVLDDRKETLMKIIEEHLGRDCEGLFREILAELRKDGDDYEKIADGYLSMLQDTMQELESILERFKAPQLDRQKVHRCLRAVYDNIYENL